ncbi:MAG: 23S rRNA (pseudouridine(1915)-N(3))-methyltransferase RlmH [Ruminococcus sp.]|jgi:23S rRNA (pseudouridine1915-N3)-methyltransferase|nr:23S rRNA (pseudouridine(1915)-N(3))-methyltransferase RlmH [Ruminococcus sp.]
MKIKIVCVGKLKSEFSHALNEYVKRMGRFCKLEIVELPESFIPEKPSDSDIKKALFVESVNIKKHLSGTVVVLSLDGKQMSSESFAKYLSDKAVVTFVIGSSHGLDEAVPSDLKLSFGKFTFPHSLMRVILVEQIYRAFMINSGSVYHK